MSYPLGTVPLSGHRRADRGARSEAARGLHAGSGPGAGYHSRADAGHRLSDGRWQRAHSGVYRLAGTTPSWSQDLFAAWLAAGPEAVVSHGSAAAVWGMSWERTPLEITVPAGRLPRTAGVRVHRAAALDRVDRTTLDGLAITTATRTLIDLAASSDAVALGAALDHSLSRRLTSIRYIRRRLLALGPKGRPGARLLSEVLDARPEHRRAPESEFERRLLEVLAQLPGPAPVPQYEVRTPSGRVFRLDAAYPDVMLGIEADSFVHHSSATDWSADQTRRNELIAGGWRILPVTWETLLQPPDALLSLVRQARSVPVAR